MKQKIAFVLGFIALLFVVDRVGGEILGQLVISSNLRVSMLYSGRIDTDVLVIGNSRGATLLAREAWEQALCRPVFNLSLNGLDVRTQDALLRDLVDHNPAPKVVVIELSNVFNSNVTALELTPFLAESARLGALVRGAQGTWIPWLDISHLFRFNSEYLQRAILFLFRPSDQAPETMGEISPGRIESFLSNHPRYDVNPESLSALAGTVAALRDHGVQPILVLAPYHPSAFSVEDWRAEVLAKLRAARIGADIRDWSDALRDDIDFADPLHMTPHGRRVLLAGVKASDLGRTLSRCDQNVNAAERQLSVQDLGD